MIIASKGHVRMKGKGVDIFTEFGTIVDALLDFKDISPDIIKAMVDYAASRKKKEDPDNEHRSN